MIPRQFISFFLTGLFLSFSFAANWPCCANQTICPETLEESEPHHHHTHEVVCSEIIPDCEKPFHHRDHCDKNFLDFLLCLINLTEKPCLNIPFISGHTIKIAKDRTFDSIDDFKIGISLDLYNFVIDRVGRGFKRSMDNGTTVKSWIHLLHPERGPPASFA